VKGTNVAHRTTDSKITPELYVLAKRTAVVLGAPVLFLATGAFVYARRLVLIGFLFAIFFADLEERRKVWTVNSCPT
jgi:hypothetical protein